MSNSILHVKFPRRDQVQWKIGRSQISKDWHPLQCLYVQGDGSILATGQHRSARTQHRRLVLTANALLERRPATYEVAERRQLAGLAAAVRFAADPQWLALEWADGSASSLYVTPSRDALLATLLDAAQVWMPKFCWHLVLNVAGCIA